MSQLTLQQEYEAYLAIYKAMQSLPESMRSQYFTSYFNELDMRLGELGAAIRIVEGAVQTEILSADIIDDNLPCQLSELENI